MLCAVGDLVEDIVVWLSGPARPATDTPVRIFHRRGGSAANVAAFAAAIAGTARFVGGVGDDDRGDRLVRGLTADGVDAKVQRAGRTGTVVVLVDPSGERTMLPDRGASIDLRAIPEAWLSDVDVVHVPAYSLTAEPIAGSTLAFAAAARRRSVPVSVDASSVSVLEAFGPHRFRRVVAALAPAVFFAAADEAAVLDVASCPPAPVTVVKDGPRPVRVWSGEGRWRALEVPPASDVADTTGAGDAFAAGFLTAWTRGASPDEAVVAANALAGTVLSAPGAAR